MKKILVLLPATLAIVSCGPINDMKEMKNTTAEMRNTTKELAEVSKKMSSSTKRIDGYSSYTYRDMRLDTSISNGFKALNEMEQATLLEQKIIAASYYMASFEFQLWKNEDLDDSGLREHMYALSLKRLFADVKEYISSPNVVEQVPPKPKDLSESAVKIRNLYAISVALHEINPNQEALAKTNKIKLVNMLELITEGLNATVSGNISKAPEYQKIVAQNEEVAVMLLQLRFNILASKTLSFFADMESDLEVGEMALKTWKPDLSKLSNAAKIEYAAKVAKLAIDTRERLTNSGHKLAVIKKLSLPVVAKIYKNMDLSNVSEGPLYEALAELRKSF